MRRKGRRSAPRAVIFGAAVGLLLSGVVSGLAEASAKNVPPLRILVTNDDGVQAPGINETVKALTALPNTSVTVVAPLTNQSGTGARVTAGAFDRHRRQDRQRVSGQSRCRLPGRHRRLGDRRSRHLAATGPGRLRHQLRAEHWSAVHAVGHRGSSGDGDGPWHSRPRSQPRDRQRPFTELRPRCEVPRGLGSVAPPRPARCQGQGSGADRWQSQRPHLRDRPDPWTGDGEGGQVARRLHHQHGELLRSSRQTVDRRPGLRERLCVHLGTASGEPSSVNP